MDKREQKKQIWWVNIGDGDILEVEANSLTELEEKINIIDGDFHGCAWMINAVIREGHEAYLQTKNWQRKSCYLP